MSYTKEAPVPPLPIEAKRVISKHLVELFFVRKHDSDWNDIKKYLATLPTAEKAYAKFWLEREYKNPNWRQEDPHQGKPMKAHLSLVR